MKSFISLAIVVLLINVQGSPINEVLENDYGPNNHRDYTSVGGRDAIIARQIQDELQNTEALERLEINDTSVICIRPGCIVCQGLSMDWYKCIKLRQEVEQKVSEACVRIENVRKDDRLACVDLTIRSDIMTISSSDLCMLAENLMQGE